MRRVFASGIYLALLRWLPGATMPGGRLWRQLRQLAGRQMLDRCGRNVNIEHGAYFGAGRGVSLGDNSAIGVNCRLHGPVSIGDDVMMGPDVVIIATAHGMSDLTRPMIAQPSVAPRPVTIGNDVWIGTRAIVLPGVSIGDHAVIGAGAVVTRDVEPGMIAAGNPAVGIRQRLDGERYT